MLKQSYNIYLKRDGGRKVLSELNKLRHCRFAQRTRVLHNCGIVSTTNPTFFKLSQYPG